MSSHKYSEYDTDERKLSDLRFVVLGICLLACALFALTLTIDIQAQKGNIYLPSWISIGNVDDARIMLGAIIAAVSTVLGLVFSVVLLVLSMASTQFGPRLLRRFIIEQNGQGTIGLFSATFLYSLFTLVVVRSYHGQEFVPQLTTLTAVILLIIAFASLISFSQNIRKEIQTGNLIAHVDEDLSAVIDKYVALRKIRTQESANIEEEERADVLRARCQVEGYQILAADAGYLQNIDFSLLVSAATAAEVVIALKVRPGHFVINASTLAYVMPAHRGPLMVGLINDALRVGPNRTLTHDPEFAIAQIVEIGMRALGGAINDSFTGIACVDWLSNNISFLADLPDTGESWQDERGKTRLIEVSVKFPRLVSAAFDMIRQSGSSNPAILIRLLQNFTRIAPHLKNSNQRAALMRQVTAIHEAVALQRFTATDLQDLTECYESACAVLNVSVE